MYADRSLALLYPRLHKVFDEAAIVLQALARQLANRCGSDDRGESGSNQFLLEFTLPVFASREVVHRLFASFFGVGKTIDLFR